MLNTAGYEPYAKITAAAIEAGKERRAHTPHQCRNFLDAMRGLFRWAKHAGHVKIDPTAGVRIRRASKATASRCGPKMMSLPMRGDGT